MRRFINTFIFSLFVLSSSSGQSNLISDYSFLKGTRIVEPPFVDSTNFNYPFEGKILTSDQIQMLNLDEVFGKEYVEFEQSKIGINYELNLSNKFRTIAFYFYFTYNELISTLVTYDKEFNIIDHITVAYDEIAESIFRTESKIEMDKITISNYKFFNETIVENEIVEITSSGEFKTWR